MSHPKQLCLVSTVELTADSKAHHLGQAAWASSSYQEQSDDLKVSGGSQPNWVARPMIRGSTCPIHTSCTACYLQGNFII